MSAVKRPAKSVDEQTSRGRVALVLLVLLFPLQVSAADWRVTLDGVDITSAARPLELAGQLLIDATRVGPEFGISVRYTPTTVILIDRQSIEWRAILGSSQLQSRFRTIDLGGPLRFDGRTVLLPVDIVRELTGLHLAIDRNAKVISFHGEIEARPEPKPEATPPARAPEVPIKSGTVEGWQMFELPKPKEELAEQKRRERVTQIAQPFVTVLPPPHDTLRVGVGVAAVQGADYASEITALGSFNRVQTQLYTLITYSRSGRPQFYSGHLGLTDPIRHWTAEGGDLFSEIWGLARGARVGWVGRVHQPQLSVYIPDKRTLVRKATASLTDDIFLTRVFSVGGEAATDGSWLARATLRHERLGFNVYKREPSSDSAFSTSLRGEGASAYLNLFHGIALQAGVSRSGAGADRFELRNASVRLPLWRGADISADRSESETPLTRTEANGLSLGIPIGGLQLRSRYLELVSEPASSLVGGPILEQHILTTSTGYSFGSRGRIDVQTYHPLFPAGGRATEQLYASYQLSRSTLIEAVTNITPRPGGTRQYRYRLDQKFGKNFDVSVEYGQIPPYQGTTIIKGAADEPRFRVMVRRLWDVPTPVGGGSVTGAVTDDRNQPVAGVPVRLGRYLTVTDPKGVYVFEHVPPGIYRLSLDSKGVPAGYVARTGERPIEVRRGVDQQIDWTVVQATGLLRGIVFIDKNRNGEVDPGEMLPGATLILDGHTTATGADGWFAFYNLPPGTHKVRLDLTRLPPSVSAAAATEYQVSFPHAETMTVMFRLIEKPKEIQFQKIK
ncbi:MAG TPA: hypothetical protein VGK04_05220 [Thermoanaerobaculia bacterium]